MSKETYTSFGRSATMPGPAGSRLAVEELAAQVGIEVGLHAAVLRVHHGLLVVRVVADPTCTSFVTPGSSVRTLYMIDACDQRNPS